MNTMNIIGKRNSTRIKEADQTLSELKEKLFDMLYHRHLNDVDILWPVVKDDFIKSTRYSLEQLEPVIEFGKYAYPNKKYRGHETFSHEGAYKGRTYKWSIVDRNTFYYMPETNISTLIAKDIECEEAELLCNVIVKLDWYEELFDKLKMDNDVTTGDMK